MGRAKDYSDVDRLIVGYSAQVIPGVKCHYCGDVCGMNVAPPTTGYGVEYYVRCLAWRCLASGPMRRTKKRALEAYRTVGTLVSQETAS